MTEPLHDHSEATVALAALHGQLEAALRDKRWEDALHLSAEAVEWQLRLQVYLGRQHGI